jgi:hypothetical protein
VSPRTRLVLAAAVVGLAAGVLALARGGSREPAPADRPSAPAAPAAPSAVETPKPAGGAARADGGRALALVESLCAFGPRAPGTEGHDRALAFLGRRLRATGAAVLEQRFTIRDQAGRPVAATNLVARFRPDLADRVIVGAHWDTRPRADRDPDPARRSAPILGANDGGSGTALLLLLAEAMAASPAPIGVDLILFDAEDWGLEGDIAQYSLGARYYAGLLAGQPRARAGIIVDMVGDEDLAIRREQSSVSAAPRIAESIWGIAREVGADAFLDEDVPLIYDDHLPLIQAGIPTLLLIDLDYPHWHTHSDLLDKVSARSLEQVGQVLFTWIYRGAP